MEKKFVNFTNHASAGWCEKQITEAEYYGEIIDIPFPAVAPKAGKEEIVHLAGEMIEKILSYAPAAVLCQGEISLAYNVIKGLQEKGILVLAACSERKVEQFENKKQVIFEFERYREY